MDTLNERFVELTKAYKALTDEEVRNNYLQFGHPDGKQSFSIGIALPKLMVTEGNGKYVLLLYAGLLGILLPSIVGKWWYGSQRYTKEKILVASAGNLFRAYRDNIDDAGIINALSSGDEFKELLEGPDAETGLAKVERKMLTDMASLPASNARKEIEKVEDPRQRKAMALLWAYLGRLDLGDATLNAGELPVPDYIISATD